MKDYYDCLISIEKKVLVDLSNSSFFVVAINFRHHLSRKCSVTKNCLNFVNVKLAFYNFFYNANTFCWSNRRFWHCACLFDAPRYCYIEFVVEIDTSNVTRTVFTANAMHVQSHTQFLRLSQLCYLGSKYWLVRARREEAVGRKLVDKIFLPDIEAYSGIGAARDSFGSDQMGQARRG